jgi:hypothetical protein
MPTERDSSENALAERLLGQPRLADWPPGFARHRNARVEAGIGTGTGASPSAETRPRCRRRKLAVRESPRETGLSGSTNGRGRSASG